MKQIVIVGGGFGGVTCALDLARANRHRRDLQITLVDKQPYHLIHAHLYEVATSPEEITDLLQLKKSIAVPLKEIFKPFPNITVITDELYKVDQQSHNVVLKNKILSYDYLVLALGSAANFYGIPGANEYSIPLKELKDALNIRNRIEFLIQAHRLEGSKDKIRIAIAGGGFAGVEIAAELVGLLDFLAWKNNFPREKLEIMVVEGANQLLPGMDFQVARDVALRLRGMNVNLELGTMIAKVDPHFLEFRSGERLEHDCLIWTAGVKANEAVCDNPPTVDKGQRIMVNADMQAQNDPNIFVIGDQACFLDPGGHPLPGTASQAEHQAGYVAYAITSLFNNKQPKPFVCEKFGYIIPLGGKWAVLKTDRLYIKGFLAYLIRQISFFNYYRKLLGFGKAFKLSIFENELYSKND